MWIELEDGNRKPDERKELRWNIPIPVSVKGVRRDGTEFNEETITADASPSGMCVLLTVALRKGDQVTVTAPEERFESSATVRYVSALGPGMNRIRVNFPKAQDSPGNPPRKSMFMTIIMDSGSGILSITSTTTRSTRPLERLRITRLCRWTPERSSSI